jgi:hypothetical protein
LCRLTYCVTKERSHLTGLDPCLLTSAVLQALPLQDMVPGQQQQQQRKQQQQQKQKQQGHKQQQQKQQQVPSQGKNARLLSQQPVVQQGGLGLKALGGRWYDLVMLLRHTCKLNFQPPEGEGGTHYLHFHSIIHGDGLLLVLVLCAAGKLQPFAECC